MNVLALTPTTNIQPKINNQPQKLGSNTNCKPLTKLGCYPSYYCSNINFKSAKFGTIDFEFDFYNRANDILQNHLDKMDLTKDLTKAQQKDFRNNLFSCDKTTLFQFFYDKKPSIMLTGEYPYFKNNDKYDFVRRTIQTPLPSGNVSKSTNTFAINRDLTKQTIAENKELYAKRMKLDKDSSVDEIYNKLIGQDSPLKKQYGYDDIIGVTLGFSPINSILFQLETNNSNRLNTRKNRTLHAKILEQSFKADNSPYKDFSEGFKTKVLSSIEASKNYFRIPDLSQVGYGYIHITEDEAHNNKIIKNAEKILEESEKLYKD